MDGSSEEITLKVKWESMWSQVLRCFTSFLWWSCERVVLLLRRASQCRLVIMELWRAVMMGIGIPAILGSCLWIEGTSFQHQNLDRSSGCQNSWNEELIRHAKIINKIINCTTFRPRFNLCLVHFGVKNAKFRVVLILGRSFHIPSILAPTTVVVGFLHSLPIWDLCSAWKSQI